MVPVTAGGAELLVAACAGWHSAPSRRRGDGTIRRPPRCCRGEEDAYALSQSASFVGDIERGQRTTRDNTKPDNQIELTGQVWSRRRRPAAGQGAARRERDSPLFGAIGKDAADARLPSGPNEVLHTIEPRMREQSTAICRGLFNECRKAQEQPPFLLPLSHRGERRRRVRSHQVAVELRRFPQHTAGHLVDTVVVVTHGLTMRLILMCGWSPNTFIQSTMRELRIVLLTRDLSIAGRSARRMDGNQGDDHAVNHGGGSNGGGGAIADTITDARRPLSIPAPRMVQLETVCTKLSQQHGLEASSITSVHGRLSRCLCQGIAVMMATCPAAALRRRGVVVVWRALPPTLPCCSCFTAGLWCTVCRDVDRRSAAALCMPHRYVLLRTCVPRVRAAPAPGLSSTLRIVRARPAGTINCLQKG